jgi:glycosyltransferase involved in cell wall biosynthesis
MPLRQRRSGSSIAMARVLHLAAELSAGVRGFLAMATHELLRSGVQPTVVHCRSRAKGYGTTGGGPAFDTAVRTIELDPGPPSRWPWPALRVLGDGLRNELREHHYDAVHLHGFGAGFAGRAVLRPRREGPPVFYSPHGLSCLHPRRRLFNAAHRLFERVAACGASQSVGASPGEAQWLTRLTGQRAALLMNPVEPEYFDSVLQPDEQPLVVTIGRVCEQKGPDTLAQVAARFAFAEEAVRFVWVGGGEARDEQILRAAGVEVTGWLPPHEVRAWLLRAHVYVQPSRWEGLALPLLQAMAAGVPCVVTDVVGNRDAVLHNVTGLVAQDVAGLALRIKTLLDAPSRAKALADAARRHANRQFAIERFRGELLSLYRLHG